LIVLPSTKNSRRIRAIVSTHFIPRHPSSPKDGQCAKTTYPGVKLARRNTAYALSHRTIRRTSAGPRQRCVWGSPMRPLPQPPKKALADGHMMAGG
jgi:hypothetical protein